MRLACPRCGAPLPPRQRPGLCASCLGAPAGGGPAGLRRGGENVQVQCLCGWQFFVSRSAPAFVNCPQCRAPVSTTAARSHEPGAAVAAPAPPPTPAPAEPAAPPPRPSRAPLVVVAASAALVLAAAVLALVLLRSRPEPAPVALRPPDPVPTPLPPEPAPRKPAPAAPRADYVDYSARIDRLVAQANMAGIAGCILLETGRASDHAELEERLRVFDREIRHNDRLRSEQGEKLALPTYFLAGDRLVALSRLVRDPARPVPFADGLKDWIRGFRAGLRETATVVRGNERVSFETRFPERTKELNLLAQRTGIMLGESAPSAARPPDPFAPPPPPVPPPPAPSPYAPLLAEMRAQVEKLHPYYRTLAEAEEKERLRQAAVQGVSAAADLDALRYRALAELRETFATEHASFASRAADLEKTLPSLPGLSDVVHFKDGRKIEGSVEEQTEEKVRIRSRLGAATFPADQILRVEKGKGAAQTFPPKLQAARGKAPELEALLAWCRDSNLPVHRELVANVLLDLEPGHDRARADAGFTRLPSGLWVRAEDARLHEGKIEWRGRYYAPDQLRTELRSIGYLPIGNFWFEKVPGSFRIDNLYRDENLLARHLRSGSVQSQLQTDRDTVYDVRLKAWVPRTRQVAVARYLSGGSSIRIEAPGPILECRVKARGQTPRTGDSVSVSVSLGERDPSPKLLYTLTAPGENAQTFDVTEKVRGHTSLYVTASLAGGGMFLPSDTNDLAVFEVKYSWGRPLAKLNELLAAKVDPVLSPRQDPNAPPPAPIPLTAETSLASVNAEARARAAAAQAALKQSFSDVLDDVRRSMEGQFHYREMSVPARFYSAADLIQTPLQPRLEVVPRDRLIWVNQWWAALPLEERIEFAAFYGLWCARVRAYGK